MTRLPKSVSIFAVIATLAIATPVVSFAQGTGGANAGALQGAVGPGAPSAPGTPSPSDPSGVAGAAKGQPSAPGTNSLGTAQSSGSLNTAPGTTTGTGSGETGDAAVNAENKLTDKKVKGICRGC